MNRAEATDRQFPFLAGDARPELCRADRAGRSMNPTGVTLPNP
jgi:hypothetical protein